MVAKALYFGDEQGQNDGGGITIGEQETIGGGVGATAVVGEGQETRVADGGAAAVAAEEVQQDSEEVQHDYGENTVLPPPPSWYRSAAAAARDDMWGYISGGLIVLVYPPKPCAKYEVGRDGLGAVQELQNQNFLNDDVGVVEKRWPKFDLMGAQLEKYNAISFCQTSWDYLPVKDSPLVSGCERGMVCVWNLKERATVIYNDTHSESQVMGLDWSSYDHAMIYSIDDKATMSVWNVVKNNLRSMNFGKVVPTSLSASPHEKDVVCFGTKGGNVMIVDVSDVHGKILAKVRHEEEVVVVRWIPKGEWNMAQFLKTKGTTPLLASSTHSMKLPTVRIWNKQGHDVGILQSWAKETKARPFKMFGCAAWVKDPNSGHLILVSSNRHGELVFWSGADGADHTILHKVHTHNAVFSIVQCGDILWSLSYEPMIVGWNLRTMEIECVIPTFKGCCNITPSPVDSSRLATGGTDSVIRILKCSNGYPLQGDSCTKPPFLTNKLKGKVTAIAWHPTRDNCIGFGTDEGILGVFELKESNRFALTFDRRINGTVYTVAFGPPVSSQDHVNPKDVVEKVNDSVSGNSKTTMDEVNGVVVANAKEECHPPALQDERASAKEKQPIMLYACGGYTIFMVHPSKASNSLTNVGKIIEKANRPVAAEDEPRSTERITEMRWAPDYSMLVVGYNDGRIEILLPPYLKLKCWIRCHVRAIQYLVWRPFEFNCEDNETGSARWLASASNDGTIRLYNLGALFQTKETVNSSHEGQDGDLGVTQQESLTIISSEVTLQGHGTRVISCAWSPHDKNLLVSVSYDKTAIVWNVSDGSYVGRYLNHQQRLVACCFHPTDPFKVISLSDEQSSDASFHIWDYRAHPFRKAALKVPGPGHTPLPATKAENISNPGSSGSKAAVRTVDIQEHGASGIHPVRASAGEHWKQKPKTKSLLPLSANGLINMKLPIAAEIKFLVDNVPFKKSEEAGKTPPGDDPAFYLSILKGAKECSSMMQIERESHDSKKQLENSTILSAWMSDSRWIELAIKNRQVTETILHVAAFFSRKLHVEAMNVYAAQLVDAEEYVRASTFYFLLGDCDRAVKVLVDNGLYREAVAFLKSNLPENDPRVIEVKSKWAQKTTTDGNFELACKIYCSIGHFPNALAVIEQRDFPYAYQAACYIASKIGDQQKLEASGVKFVIDRMANKSYNECNDLINEYPILKWLKVMVWTHKQIFGLGNRVKTPADSEMWQHVQNSLLAAYKRSAEYEESLVSTSAQKISTNILISIAQTQADAQLMISRNLCLLFGEVLEKDAAMAKLEEIANLCNNWF